MKDQDKFSLTILSRDGDNVIIRQIRPAEGPVWAALIDHIFHPPAEAAEKWWLEVERLDNGYRITVMVPGSGKYPKHTCVIYLSEGGQARLRTEDVAGLLETH